MVTQALDGSVEFRFFRSEAQQVHVAGDFNTWQRDGLPMVKESTGWWHCRLALTPGVYQFRYLADGKWFTDFAAFGLEPGPFGWNSVLKVDAPAKVADTDRQAVKKANRQAA